MARTSRSVTGARENAIFRFSPEFLTASVGLALLAAVASLGLLQAWPSPDTPSFLASVGLGNPRLPPYGWLLHLFPGEGVVLPFVQWATFIAASSALAASIHRFGASWAAATSAGLALVSSNLLLLWGNALLPEVLGHAAIFLALAVTLELTRRGPSLAGIAAVSAAVTLGWTLRSSLLPFVVMVPVMPILLAPRRRRLALWLGMACLAPALLLSAVRLERVGDFNVVSYGGYQMSGMATLMLTPEIVDRLPAGDAGLGRELLARRTALEAAGKAMAVPLNSTGQRSFISAAIFYFDLFARTHEDVLWGAVAPQQRPDEDWPSFNRRLQHFDIATIRAAPVPYAAWVMGATSRLVGHALVLNPSFLLAAGTLLLLAWRRPRPVGGVDWRVLLVVVGVYTVGTGALSVLITFPASRYIDCTAALLAALPLYGVLRRVA
jgi:hypothetical protein